MLPSQSCTTIIIGLVPLFQRLILIYCCVNFIELVSRLFYHCYIKKFFDSVCSFFTIAQCCQVYGYITCTRFILCTCIQQSKSRVRLVTQCVLQNKARQRLIACFYTIPGSVCPTDSLFNKFRRLCY